MGRGTNDVYAYLPALVAAGLLAPSMRVAAQNAEGSAAIPRTTMPIAAVTRAQDTTAEQVSRVVAHVRDTAARGHAALAMLPGAPRPLEPLDPAVLQTLTRANEQALELVAFGRNQRTREIVASALEGIDPHLASIGRDVRLARTLENVCLFAVRARAQERRPQEARAQALECIRLAPDIDPTNSALHPPDVTQLIGALRQEITPRRGDPVRGTQSPARSTVAGTLVVEARGRVSDCAIRIQGRAIGRAPRAELQLPIGSYAVEVSCGPQPGLIYQASLDAGSTTRLVVFPDVRLQDEDVVVGSARIAEQLSELTGNDFLHVEGTAGATRVTRFGNGGVIAIDAVEHAAAERLSALNRGSSPSAQALRANDSAASTSEVEVGAVITSSIGIVGFGVAFGFFADWSDKQTRYLALPRPPDPAVSVIEMDAERQLIGAQALRNDAQTASIAFGLGAAVITSIGIAWLLEPTREVPWWSWASGAIGLAFVGTGVVMTALHDQSLELMPNGAYSRNSTLPLGPMIASLGAPFLTVPLTHLFERRDDHPTAGRPRIPTASFEVDRNSFVVHLGGTFPWSD